MNELFSLLHESLRQTWHSCKSMVIFALRIKMIVEELLSPEYNVAILGKNSKTWSTIFLGVLCSSRKLIILDLNMAQHELHLIIQANNINLIFCDEEGYEKIDDLKLPSLLRPSILVWQSEYNIIVFNRSYGQKEKIIRDILSDRVLTDENASDALSLLFSKQPINPDTAITMYERLDYGLINDVNLSYHSVFLNLIYLRDVIKFKETNLIMVPFSIYPILGILLPLIKQSELIIEKKKKYYPQIKFIHNLSADGFKLSTALNAFKPELVIISKNVLQKHIKDVFKMKLFFSIIFELMYRYRFTRWIALNRLKSAIFAIFGGHVKEFVTTGVMDSLISQELMEKGLPVRNSLSDLKDCGLHHVYPLKHKPNTIGYREKYHRVKSDISDVIVETAEALFFIKEAAIIKHITDNSVEKVLLVSLNEDGLKAVGLNQIKLELYLDSLLKEINSQLSGEYIRRIKVYPRDLPKDIEGNLLKDVFAEITT